MNALFGFRQAFLPFLSPRAFLRASLWPFLVFALALLPRLIDLGNRSFWLDEIFTYNRASLTPAALALDSFQNHHMPWFFLLLSPLTHMAHPEYWLRLPSAIFGAFSVAMVFIIAARIAGRLAGVLAALYLGLSPIALGFAQEARSYTLVMALILIALYGVVRLAQDWRTARAGWLCYVLGTISALGLLGDSLPWFIAANLIFIGLLPFVPEAKRFILRVLLADVTILAVTAPLYGVMLHYQSQAVTTSLGWIPQLSLSQIWYSFGSIYLMHVPDWVSFKLLTHHQVPGLVWLLDLLLLVSLGAAVWHLRRWPEMLITLVISFLFLPCLFLLISTVQPVLLPRYLLWSAAPFAVLVGIGTSVVLTTRITPVALQKTSIFVVAVILALNLLPYYKNELKPDWSVAAQKLAEDVKPGDVVLFSDTGAVPILKYYLASSADALVIGSPYTSLTDAEAALKQGKRVWVIYGHAGQNTSTHGSFFVQIQQLGMPSLVQKAGKRITIALYDQTYKLASGG